MSRIWLPLQGKPKPVPMKKKELLGEREKKGLSMNRVFFSGKKTENPAKREGGRTTFGG